MILRQAGHKNFLCFVVFVFEVFYFIDYKERKSLLVRRKYILVIKTECLMVLMSF